MTSAIAKDMSRVVQNVQSVRGIMNQSAQKEVFSEVFQRQTKSDTQDKETETKVQRSEPTSKPVAEEAKAEGTPKKSTLQSESKEETIPSEDEQNRAAEVLGQAAIALVAEIVQYFQVDEAEILSAMQELQMTPTQLLDAQALSHLLMQISDTPDSLTLLTNEVLYDSFQTLQAKALELLQQSAEAAQLEAGKLLELAGEDSVELQVTTEVVEALQGSPQAGGEVQVSREPEAEPSLTKGTEQKEQRLQTQNGYGAASSAATEVKQNIGTENAGQNSGHRDRGENPSSEAPMVQLVLEKQFENATQQLESQLSADNPDTQDIMRQIMDYMKVTLKPDMSSIEMQLHPESLGTVQVQVANKGGLITAQFVTQNENVRAALESQMVTLRENFEEQGVKIEAIEVTVQTHQFESGYDQGARGGQETPARRNRTRRIQMDEISAMENLEDLETEERIAAEMMTANGGTIDYTA